MELYIFDLDGTIIDSSKDIAKAVNYAFEKLKLNKFPEEEIVKYVGYGARKLIEDLIPNKQDYWEESLNLFREYYNQNPSVYTKPYPYVKELLEYLKENNKNIAVLTNKYEKISKDILKDIGLWEYIDLVVGADTLDTRKPEPDGVYFILKVLEKNKEESILIGDSEVDVLTGKNAGIKTALLLHGYGNKELAKNLNPDYIFKDFKDLLNEVKKWNGKQLSL